MGLFKDLKELKKDVAEIKAALVGDLEKKGKEYDEIKEDLSYVSLKVKSIVETVDETGKPALKIIYEAPQILLTFDDNGNVLENSIFKAINGLDLISMSDKMKLIESINRKKI